ncbi:MAG: AMP-binding protein [Planctomycetaceae bacterium]
MATVTPATETLNEELRPACDIYPPGVPHTLDYPDIAAWGLLDRAARLLPKHTGCLYNNVAWSWEELNQAACKTAAMLKRQGIEPGDRVGLLLPNIPEYLIALNGIWPRGGVAVAISPLCVAEEVTALVNATDCRLVVSLDMLAHLLTTTGGDEDDELPPKILFISLRHGLSVFEQLGYLVLRRKKTGRWWMEAGERIGWFWDEVGRFDADEPQHVPADIDPATTPAYILATGGTTGMPKAVTLSHRNMVANAWQQYFWAGASVGQERLLSVLPFFHSYGLSTNVMGGAAMAATLIMDHRFNVRQAIRLIETYRPTVFHAVPAMLVAMNEHLRTRKADLTSIKWVISGGSTLPVAVGEEFAAHTGAIVVEGYGLSEASPVTHVGPLNENARYGTIGLPLPDTECRLVSTEDGRTEVGKGESGELLVRGPQVMLGYWKNDEATRQAIHDGWLSTGDIAVRTPEGLYQIVDRKKDLIITSSFNVVPREVEDVLRRFPGVEDAAVVGVPDEHRGEIVKAFIVMKDASKWDEDAINHFCREHLAAHKRPRALERCDSLPKNFLGKVIRRHLREDKT